MTTAIITIHYFDASGNPTDDEVRCTRATVTEAGKVRLELSYLDGAGNPTPHAHACQVNQTNYDADGNVTGYTPAIIAGEGEPSGARR